MEQSKLDEAEPLLLQGYQGLEQRKHRIPRSVKYHLRDAAAQLVEFYKVRDDADAQRRWQEELDSIVIPPMVDDS